MFLNITTFGTGKFHQKDKHLSTVQLTPISNDQIGVNSRVWNKLTRVIIRPVLLSLEDVMTLPINYYDQVVIAKYFVMKARTPRIRSLI